MNRRYWLTLGLIAFLGFSGWHIMLTLQTLAMRAELDQVRAAQELKTEGYYCVVAEAVTKEPRRNHMLVLERFVP
jgi:hypothetical protein